MQELECSTRVDRSGTYRVLVWKSKETIHLADLGVDGRIILKLIFKKWNVIVDGIDLAQDRMRWRAVVSEVMNLSVP